MWIDLEKMYSFLFSLQELITPKVETNIVDKSFLFLKNFSKDTIIYGINTGFGSMILCMVSDESLKILQNNIIRSHTTEASKSLETTYVKTSITVRLNTFLQGKSGIHNEAVKLLADFINKEIYPHVLEHWGIGASGDLVQLAYIALCIIGEVFYKGGLRETSIVLAENNIRPLSMHIQEGLLITNGTSVMTRIGFVNTIYAWLLMHWAIMVNEIVSSCNDFMTPELNETKHQNGYKGIATLMRKIFQDSKLLRNRQKVSYAENERDGIFDHKVQPYYSPRCIPQILSAIYDTIANTEKVMTDKINSVCDNPIVDVDTQNVYYGGNFHEDYFPSKCTN